MGINDDTFSYFNEQNRRINANNYQASFPMIQALQKTGGLESDPDYENVIGDYSGAPQTFEFLAFGSADAYINQVHVTVVSTTMNDYNDYGNISGGLTNGVVIAFFQKGEFRFVSPTFKVNHDYQRLFNGDIKVPGWQFGARSFTATLSIDVPIILKGGSTDALYIQVNDDFSSLIAHSFTATGFTTNLKEFQGE